MPVKDPCVGGKYQIGQMIARGAFGCIYFATNIESGEQVAVKVEKKKMQVPQLRDESRAYKRLDGGAGIPRLHWFGQHEEYLAMAIDLRGPSLEQLRRHCKGRFSLKTVLLLADQLITCLEHIHKKSLVHCDLKPGNMVMGVNERADEVSIIDFGLADMYRDPKSLAHIKNGDGHGLTGTAIFASPGNHLGMMLSRRDDMESLGYVLVYLHNGRLPWHDVRAPTRKQENKLIRSKMLETTVDDLCRGMPAEFSDYFNSVRSLSFRCRPDYAYLRQRFRELAHREGVQYDAIFDWTVDPGQDSR